MLGRGPRPCSVAEVPSGRPPTEQRVRDLIVREGTQRGSTSRREVKSGPCWGIQSNNIDSCNATDTPRRRGLGRPCRCGWRHKVHYRGRRDGPIACGAQRRETHPIFPPTPAWRSQRRRLRGDPRRTSSDRMGDVWLGMTSAATSPSPMPSGREIIANGIEDKEFNRPGATKRRFRGPYKAKVESYTLEYAERARPAIPADAIARAPTPLPRPTGDDLLDARVHRAPQRRRQRSRPDSISSC